MRRVLIALVMLALFASACSGGSDDSAAAGTPAVPAPTEVPSTTAAGDTDDGADSQDDEVDPADADASAASVSTRAPFCEVGEIGADRSLNLAGSLMFAQHNLNGDGWPTYRLDADIDPVSGMVNARMRAVVPDRSEQLNFRVFPGVASFEADLSISEVTVDGVAATSSLTEALLTIDNPTPNGTANPVIELEFAYVLQETAASSNLLEGLTGESLEPAKVGLLGRTPGGAQLGHWFPDLVAAGVAADSSLDGFGDIGAFPAAGICVTLRTPSSYELISGGTALTEPETTGDGMTIRTEGALGLRDLSLLLTQDLTMVTADVDGVAVNVWGPADNEAATATVLDYAVSSQTSLVNAFGPYPWSEIDVVSAPLGSGVGGMEWPGMVWIESSIFAGGLPGLGSLTDTGLFPETGPDLGSIEDLISSGLFDELLAELPGGQALETSLEWTVAHELGHEWWHAVVGNDSVESPAVDEPLAQFAACVAMRDLHPENWRDICEAQTIDTYAQFEDPVWRGRCTSRTAIGCV